MVQIKVTTPFTGMKELHKGDTMTITYKCNVDEMVVENVALLLDVFSMKVDGQAVQTVSEEGSDALPPR